MISAAGSTADRPRTLPPCPWQLPRRVTGLAESPAGDCGDKFGIMRGSKPSAGGGWPITGINGRPEYVRAACDASLKRLGVERIDLYYQHRVDAED
jgi:hypothetical protein